VSNVNLGEPKWEIILKRFVHFGGEIHMVGNTHE